MNTETFSLIFLRNIWASRSRRKLPLLAYLVLCAIGQGVTRRVDIIERCRMNVASFYSTVATLSRDGLVIKVDAADGRKSVYELTDAGHVVYRRLFKYRTGEMV